MPACQRNGWLRRLLAGIGVGIGVLVFPREAAGQG